MPNRKSLYRAMEILPLLLVVVLVFSAICLANSKEIVLRYDGQEKVVTTILEDPRSILEESGVKVGKEDRILISPANAEKKTREVIELKRALPAASSTETGYWPWLRIFWRAAAGESASTMPCTVLPAASRALYS